VVVDSYQFAVAANKTIGSVDVQHFGWGLSDDRPPSRTLISEFGLSMHAESKRGSETGNLLMDSVGRALITTSGCWPLTQPAQRSGAEPWSLCHFGGVVGFCSKTRAS
jgi:7,8-dihydropterin-6-yl-methyl-4-(beta-D-ribofuranosyl)aminobenzene 5'-phosphate synthase